MAGHLAACARILVVGSGIDYVGARELALKLEEGPRIPAHALQLETLRHGHLAAADARTLLPEIIAIAADAGIVVSSVEVSEPDLEAVFLHLTGKALRD